MEEIKLKYHTCPNMLRKTESGDYIDLYTAEDVEIRNFEFKKINLGVSMQLPEGYEAQIIPRSSTFGRYHLIQTNHMGLIDNAYNGTNDVWSMPVLKLPVIDKNDGLLGVLRELFIRPKTVIKKGTRLCQFRIVKSMGDVQFHSVDRLNSTDRGGYGTTGN